MDFVTEELIFEILLYLPIKTVGRLVTVSKKWHSIISSPQFRHLHASRSSRLGKVLGIFYKTTRVRSYGVGFIPLITSRIAPSILPTILSNPCNPYLRLTSSSGGLLLLQSSTFKSFGFRLELAYEFFVCNPTTNEVKQLPFPLLNSKLFYPVLAFDPCKSPNYKVVIFFKNQSSKFFQNIIYSSETKRFSPPMKMPSAKLNFSSDFYLMYYNDAIHWISTDMSFHSFDLKREGMKDSPPLPPYDSVKYFGMSQGHLHLACVHRDTVLVYDLKIDNSGWSVKYQVNLAYMSKAFPDAHFRSTICKADFLVLSIIVDKEDEPMMVLRLFALIEAYNFNHNLPSTRLGVDRFRGFDNCIVWQHMETLACV